MLDRACAAREMAQRARLALEIARFEGATAEEVQDLHRRASEAESSYRRAEVRVLDAIDALAKGVEALKSLAPRATEGVR